MKNFLIAFFVFLLWSILGMWYYSCMVKGLCGNDFKNTSEPVLEEPIKKTESSEDVKAEKKQTKVLDSTTALDDSLSDKVLYASFAQNGFKPDASLRSYIDTLKTYINKHPEQIIYIIGHTDNVGAAEDNLWIGKQRAKTVRRYLISMGILADRIEASSKGEDEPIVPNSSYANRSKNRRIEIKVY